jgi:2'-5' RNA ligase
MPCGSAFEQVDQIIRGLSQRLGVPGFEPHVTVLGGLLDSEADVVAKASQLAASMDPFEIECDRLEFLNEFYKCLFLRAVQAPPVMDANAKARTVFERADDETYMPHLSLLYGHFPVRTKQQLVAELGREWNLRFEVESIHLYSTEGRSDEWYRIKEFPMRRADQGPPPSQEGRL